MADHRIVTKEDIKKLEDFIAKANALVTDKSQHEFNEQTIEISKVAQKEMADNNEKASYLYSMLTQQAHRLMFYLFEQGLHTPEVEAEYRTLDKMDVAGKMVQDYADERKAAEDELVAQMKVHHDARQGINVFTGILSGKTPEEAKRALDEYNQQVAQQ